MEGGLRWVGNGARRLLRTEFAKIESSAESLASTLPRRKEDREGSSGCFDFDDLPMVVRGEGV